MKLPHFLSLKFHEDDKNFKKLCSFGSMVYLKKKNTNNKKNKKTKPKLKYLIILMGAFENWIVFYEGWLNK